MIIYNVTTKVDWSIQEEWKEWMKQEHIPELINTGKFFDYQFVRLLEVDEKEGPTYAVQYYAKDKEHYNQYIQDFSASMREKASNRWGNKIISFRTVMQVVN